MSTSDKLSDDTSRPLSRGSNSSGGADVQRALIIGIAGGTSSGKTEVCERIIERLHATEPSLGDGHKRALILSEELFYKPLSDEECRRAAVGQYNFDHPSALDYELIVDTLTALSQRRTDVWVPQYDFCSFRRSPRAQWRLLPPADVVFYEGLFVFYWPFVRHLLTVKAFVDLDSDVRLAKRVQRDVKLRGRPIDQVLDTYENFVQPAYEDFIQPTKKYADLIIPRGIDNAAAIDVFVQHCFNYITSSKRRTPVTDATHLTVVHETPASMQLHVSAGSDHDPVKLPLSPTSSAGSARQRKISNSSAGSEIVGKIRPH